MAVIVDANLLKDQLTHLELAMAGPGLVAFLSSEIEPYLRERAKRRFESEGDDVVGKWAPLKAVTQEIRANMGYGPAHPINMRTGQLEQWVTGSSFAVVNEGEGAFLRFPNQKASGVLGQKIATAQQGRDKPATPPRPVLGLDEVEMEFIEEALSLYLEGRW